MERLSLDWNCVIEVEENRAEARAVRSLVEMHRSGRLEVGLLATSASENLRNSPGLPITPDRFRDRIAALGWADLPIVPTLAVWGMTFWGSAFWADGSEGPVISALWSVIGKTGLPKDLETFRNQHGIPASLPLEATEFSRWRNTWCDVHSALAHIKAERDVFITTNTKDFQHNAADLAKLGMSRIETPTSYLTNRAKT